MLLLLLTELLNPFLNNWEQTIYSIRFVLLSNISVTIETNFINYQNWPFVKQIISKQQRCIWTIHTTSKLTTSVLPIPKNKKLYIVPNLRCHGNESIEPSVYLHKNIFKANYLHSAKVYINNSYRV